MSKNDTPQNQVEKFLVCFFEQEDECIYHTERPRFLAKITDNPLMPFMMVDEIDNIQEYYGSDKQKCSDLINALCAFWSKYSAYPGEAPELYSAQFPLPTIELGESQDKFVYCEYGNIHNYVYHTHRPRFLAKIDEQHNPPFEIVDDIDNMRVYYSGDKNKCKELMEAVLLWWDDPM